MVEARHEEGGATMPEAGDQLPLEFDLEQFKKLLNDPKYMDSAETEIEKMLTNAKVSLS